MDYPVQIASQLKQLLKSLRKSRQITQADLARRLGVVQSRVADIERDPGAVSVDQLMQVLALLGAQVVVRETGAVPSATQPGDGQATARVKATDPVTRTTGPKPAGAAHGAQADEAPDDEPRGQW